MKDEDGQLIVISGFIMAMGLVVLAIMLNSVIYMGNNAYEGTIDINNKDILYINDLTLRESQNAYDNSWPSGFYDDGYYDRYMDDYSTTLKKLSAYKGKSVSIKDSTCIQDIADPNIAESTTILLYSDGEIKNDYSLITNVIHTP